MPEKQIDLIDIEFKEIRDYINTDIYLTKMILVVFSILSLCFILFLKIQMSLFVPMILFTWFLVYFLYDNLVDKKKNTTEIRDLHFKIAMIECFFITAIIHFIGGIEWIGGIFYLLNILLSSVILPKRENRILIFSATILFSLLIVLEFYGVIPHRTLFQIQGGEHYFQNPFYIIVTITTLFFFLLFSSDMTGSFSEILRRNREALTKARIKIARALSTAREARDVLEIRVEARTRELENLAKELENQVAERTSELEKKVGELEKANKLMVGRELKMVELKKEIKDLEKELSKLSK